MNWAPLRFHPLYQERVWGGSRLASIYHRPLPAQPPIGESWEISDRPGAISVVAEGPLAGWSLSELMAADAPGLLGDARPREGRFPLLVKILDAQADLSLQVHPPRAQAAALGGEPKTELWYFTHAEPGAEIYVGLRPGVTRENFEDGIRSGTVADLFHRLPVHAGDAMFLPSGRVHALGAGLMLFEIQENSDTTYRVHDWNRAGLDGKPRPLHVRESLACIDFNDLAPGLVSSAWRPDGPAFVRPLVLDPTFMVEARRATAGSVSLERLARCRVLGVVAGEVRVSAGGESLRLRAGEFGLLPAALHEVRLATERASEWIVAEPASASSTPDL